MYNNPKIGVWCLLNLDLFNNILNNVKQNNVVQNFIKELTNYLEKADNGISNDSLEISSLKQEDCLYQVVDMDTDGAYLQNINNGRVSKETDLSKEILDKIGNDHILRYQKGEYMIEEELTREIFWQFIRS